MLISLQDTHKINASLFCASPAILHRCFTAAVNTQRAMGPVRMRSGTSVVLLEDNIINYKCVYKYYCTV